MIYALIFIGCFALLLVFGWIGHKALSDGDYLIVVTCVLFGAVFFFGMIISGVLVYDWIDSPTAVNSMASALVLEVSS